MGATTTFATFSWTEWLRPLFSCSIHMCTQDTVGHSDINLSHYILAIFFKKLLKYDLSVKILLFLGLWLLILGMQTQKQHLERTKLFFFKPRLKKNITRLVVCRMLKFRLSQNESIINFQKMNWQIDDFINPF